MGNLNIYKENAMKYKYAKILRLSLFPIGFWPGEEFGEYVPMIVRLHRILFPMQTVLIVVGQCSYIYKYTKDMSFLSLGHCYVTTFLGLMTLFRSLVPSSKTYGKIVKNFLMTIHLVHFKHESEFNKRMCNVINRISHIFTYYIMAMTLVGMILFNASPLYQNYRNGAFTNRSENTTLEYSIYYKYPGFDIREKFTFATVYNVYLSYNCSISISSIDLLMTLMVFQLIGHTLTLHNELKTLPRPMKAEKQKYIEPKGIAIIPVVQMYTDEENVIIHKKLIECVSHHRLIVNFAKDFSNFFGTILGANYAIQMCSLCLLLIECSPGDADTLLRFGPLTIISFGQLIQISVLFEVVGAVIVLSGASIIIHFYVSTYKINNKKINYILCFASVLPTPFNTRSLNRSCKMSMLLVLAGLLVTASGRPSGEDIGPQNVVTVPPNCPVGQEWINGECREVWPTWDINAVPGSKNVITVPPNCPSGQEYINGACRDVWRLNNEKYTVTVQNCATGQEYVNGECRDVRILNKVEIYPTNVVTVPPNCPTGQEYINGECRDVWRLSGQKNTVTVPPNCATGQEYVNGECRDVWRLNEVEIHPTNVVIVPPNCPIGQEYINGQCRDVWIIRALADMKNTVTVPPNCPSGQEYVNGKCRDIWRRVHSTSQLQTNGYDISSILRNRRGLTNDALKKVDNRNIISVPNQCPSGTKPDSLGICRPIFD